METSSMETSEEHAHQIVLSYGDKWFIIGL